MISQSRCWTPWTNKNLYYSYWRVYCELLLWSFFGKLMDKSTYWNTYLSTNANNCQHFITNPFKTLTKSKNKTNKNLTNSQYNITTKQTNYKLQTAELFTVDWQNVFTRLWRWLPLTNKCSFHHHCCLDNHVRQTTVLNAPLTPDTVVHCLPFNS